ncbi:MULTISPECIES: metal ABC transporter permease [Dehalobacter]|jgi:zinc transport system permease protein|uniref:ABC transporter n=1 Tax=Dehalobacter restrictus (strain DSM 9455 / PER-K23) TaxID=871738 RepID=A0ABM5P4M6_DEHRP|nr:MULTISPECIES: metal ABC transporter permease [Dehalobacter]AHF09495.1 ABC transporter [Dehalobacter restrictus DSM 9455]MCG1026043.1 metal ABC transporter permease [Dehalobacter sp.]MDJ0304772.1 metal ABC transporter permease [Dehalobacter sp.]OCZ50448.1 ABC transporter [Dehalobacter sp. TeCB1]
MIEQWYRLLDALLPLAWLEYDFMKNALLAVLLVTPILGILGTMIVNNRMAFFSDALGHSALTGVAAGVVLGIQSPFWALLVFSVLFAVAVISVKNANTASTDTIIGVFSSTAVALGIVLLSRNGGFSKYSGYLIGDLLSITPSELGILALIFVLVLVFWAGWFNKLLLVSVNQSLAKSRGIHVRFYEFVFAIVVAVVVTFAIRWVGILIISSLLVLPAAASRNIAANTRQYHVLAVIIALISGLAGLILSYFWGTATGATIVLVLALFFAGTFVWKVSTR